ncbi:MAG: transposase [Oscillibacter sp.]|nr:transposase [Oscillibacter sp.]
MPHTTIRFYAFFPDIIPLDSPLFLYHGSVPVGYPQEIRKIIYTTNIIEGLNRQFRQITKNKPSFTNDDSLRKMLYLASRKIVEHWTARCRNWDIVLAQLQLMFPDRKSA